MLPQWLKCGKQIGTRLRHALEELLLFQNIENGIAGGHRHRMRLISESVLKRSGAQIEGLCHPRGRNDRAERRVSAGDAFAYRDDIGLDAFVFDGEGSASPSHAGHDFVGDQQDVMTPADLGNPPHVTLRRNSRAQIRAHHRLENKSGHAFGILPEQGFQFIGTGKITLREIQTQRTAPAKTGSDMPPLGKQRQIRCAARHVPAQRHRAQGAAVITLPAGDHAEPFGLSAFQMKLTGHLDSSFVGFRSAGGEPDASADAQARGRKIEQPPRKSLCGGGGEL